MPFPGTFPCVANIQKNPNNNKADVQRGEKKVTLQNKLYDNLAHIELQEGDQICIIWTVLWDQQNATFLLTHDEEC